MLILQIYLYSGNNDDDNYDFNFYWVQIPGPALSIRHVLFIFLHNLVMQWGRTQCHRFTNEKLKLQKWNHFAKITQFRRDGAKIWICNSDSRLQVFKHYGVTYFAYSPKYNLELYLRASEIPNPRCILPTGSFSCRRECSFFDSSFCLMALGN